MRRAFSCRSVLTGALLFVASVPCMAACTVTSTSLTFSPYDVFSTLNDDITGTVTIRCRPQAAYTLSLSTGAGTFASRTLKNGTFTLGYNLYTDATRQTLWGDGTGGTATISGDARDATHTVYGRISARQNARFGNYTDTIIVTITY
jgi:spore coat protein U-like protein